MKISFVEPALPKSGTLVVGVAEDRVLTPTAAQIDAENAGLVTRAIAASRFTGKRDQTLAILAPPQLGLARLLLVGIGKPAELETAHLEALGGVVVAALNAAGETEAAFDLAGLGEIGVAAAQAAAGAGFGALLRSYRFEKYKTKEKPEQKPTLKKLAILTHAPGPARKAFATLEKIAQGVVATRDLVSEPANVLYPESFAAKAEDLRDLGVDVEILDEKKMRKLGFGALLGVGQGSVRPPRLVVLKYFGAKNKDAAPVAFVGKGITFDTGGISLKPGPGMEDMKWDMAGAGAVFGALKAIAGRKAKANVVGVLALAENMPDGNAQRPGDIVTSLSGQTIEVLNTDAEGRLVLADALWYTQDRFKPRLMVDLATLTGAVIIALGAEYAAVFSNSEELAERLQAAGKSVGENLWRMPLGDSYDREIDCDAADMKNISGGREAGSTIGAVFLQRFVNGVPWAHLDIAGTAWSKKDKATVPKGATAFGVRLLDRLIALFYED
jgi:leucyl aminopeptidase